MISSRRPVRPHPEEHFRNLEHGALLQIVFDREDFRPHLSRVGHEEERIDLALMLGCVLTEDDVPWTTLDRCVHLMKNLLAPMVIGLSQGEAFTPARAASFTLIWAGAAVFLFGAWRRTRNLPSPQAIKAAAE